jgi:hypothetical protein
VNNARDLAQQRLQQTDSTRPERRALVQFWARCDELAFNLPRAPRSADQDPPPAPAEQKAPATEGR